jgi:hypothetical protein
MATINRSFETAEAAKSIFRDALPLNWLKREENPDFYVDYFVEVDKAREPSGLKFGVQLKGTRSLKLRQNYAQYRLKTKHLKYYIDNSRQPIFIVVVDVTTRMGYWVFIQKYIKTILDSAEWRHKRSVTIELPEENKLEDIEKLYSAVKESESYMRELWPSSLDASAKAEQKQWAELDHRFDTKVEYVNGVTKILCIARDEMEFQTHFRDSGDNKLSQKLSHLFDKGQRVEFTTHEIKLTGSPLFDKFNELNFTKIELETAHKKEIELYLTSIDKLGNELARSYRIDGEFIFGRKEVRFESKNNELPLNVEISFSLSEIIKGTQSEIKPNSCNFRFNDSSWVGTSIHHLKYYEVLNAFFRSIHAGDNIKITFEYAGNPVLTGYAQSSFEDNFKNYVTGFLDLIDKIRYIAKQININPVYPRQYSFSKDKVRDIRLMYSLLKHGKIEMDACGTKMSGALEPNDNFYLKLKTKEEFDGPITIEPQDKVFELLGEKINIGALRFTLTDARLLTQINLENIDEFIKKNGHIYLEWEGKENSKLIISLI